MRRPRPRGQGDRLEPDRRHQRRRDAEQPGRRDRRHDPAASQLANRSSNGVYIFGGSTATNAPIEELRGGFRYTGARLGLLAQLGPASDVPISIGGENAIGETSARALRPARPQLSPRPPPGWPISTAARPGHRQGFDHVLFRRRADRDDRPLAGRHGAGHRHGDRLGPAAA